MAIIKITDQSLASDAVKTAKILDNNVTLAKLGDGTQGDVLYYGASGAPARLGFGTSGDFLKTQGTGANPTWATAGGGKVLQVLQDTLTSTTSTTSLTFEDIAGLTIDITPAATSSKILVMVQISSWNATGNGIFFSLVRDSTEIFIGDAASSREQITTGAAGGGPSGSRSQQNASITYLDSPSSTSALTYKVQVRISESTTGYINTTANDTDNSTYPRAASSIIVMEIGA